MRLGGVETIKVDVRDHRRHQRRPATRGRGGPLPRGPLLPPERDHDPAAAAAPAQGGHPAARPALRRQVRAGEQQARVETVTPEALQRADGLRLARQRARARERDRARRGAGDDPADRPRAGARARAHEPGFFHIPPVSVPPEGINLREVIASFERRIIESTLDVDGRRAEGRGPAPGPQADDAQRDDQAPQHPARARSSLARRPRRSRAR